MKSINLEINYLLNKDISIQKCLKKRVINTRALAKHLIKEHGLSYSLDSIISAIRRYDLDPVSLIGSKEAENIFLEMSLTTKDNVARIVLKDKAFKNICEDFLSKQLLKVNCRIIKSKEKITLIINQKELDEKLALFKPSDIIKIQKNLSEIRMQFSKDIGKIKGILARITNELAIMNVNMREIIFAVPDFLIYVKEEDLIDALKALKEIKR